VTDGGRTFAIDLSKRRPADDQESLREKLKEENPLYEETVQRFTVARR
jgi:hypothetical protein